MIWVMIILGVIIVMWIHLTIKLLTIQRNQEIIVKNQGIVHEDIESWVETIIQNIQALKNMK